MYVVLQLVIHLVYVKADHVGGDQYTYNSVYLPHDVAGGSTCDDKAQSGDLGHRDVTCVETSSQAILPGQQWSLMFRPAQMYGEILITRAEFSPHLDYLRSIIAQEL